MNTCGKFKDFRDKASSTCRSHLPAESIASLLCCLSITESQFNADASFSDFTKRNKKFQYIEKVSNEAKLCLDNRTKFVLCFISDGFSGDYRECVVAYVAFLRSVLLGRKFPIKVTLEVFAKLFSNEYFSDAAITMLFPDACGLLNIKLE